jgi:DNA-binding transcriptional LysR family regulator
MNMQRLRAFQAIMESGSVTSAADELRLTQPAVSKLLKALELEVGFPLFLRANGRLTPSAQGAAFYQRTQRILADIDALATIAQNVAENRLGEIRLVATSQLSSTLFSRAIGEFQKQCPDVFVSLEILPLRDADRWIAGLNFDLGVSALPLAWNGLGYEPFLTTAPVAVVPTTHKLSSRPSLSARDLDGQPFIRLSSANLLRSRVDADLIQSNAHPIVKAEVSSPMTACALVAEGLGIAVVDAFSPTVAKTDEFQIVPWKSSITLTYGFFYPKDNANPFVPIFKTILKRLALAEQTRTKPPRKPAPGRPANQRRGHSNLS